MIHGILCMVKGSYRRDGSLSARSCGGVDPAAPDERGAWAQSMRNLRRWNRSVMRRETMLKPRMPRPVLRLPFRGLRLQRERCWAWGLRDPPADRHHCCSGGVVEMHSDSAGMGFYGLGNGIDAIASEEFVREVQGCVGSSRRCAGAVGLSGLACHHRKVMHQAAALHVSPHYSAAEDPDRPRCAEYP